MASPLFSEQDVKDFLTGLVTGLSEEGLLNKDDIISRKEHDAQIRILKVELAQAKADRDLARSNEIRASKERDELRRQLREIRTAHDEVHRKVYPGSAAKAAAPFPGGGIFPSVPSGVFGGAQVSWNNQAAANTFEQHKKQVYPNRSSG